MQPIQASTPSATPYYSSSVPSFGKVFKVTVLGFLATLGGANAQSTFRIGNHTTGLRRASCVEIGNGEIPCEWNKDGDLYKEVFSPALEIAREQEMVQSGGMNSPSRLFKRLTGDYFSVWTTDKIRNQGYDQSHNTNTNLEVYGLSQTYSPHTRPEGAVLSNGQSVMVTMAENRAVYWPLDTDLQEIGDPDPKNVFLGHASIIPAQENYTSWVTVTNIDEIVVKWRYTGFGPSESDSFRAVSNPGAFVKFRQAKGIQFSDGTYLAAFAKISDTNQIEGYCYRRFGDDVDNTLIDGADQPILEGSLGAWDQEDAIISVVPGEDDTGWVTFIANDDVYVQQVDSSGTIGTAQPLGTTSAKEVSSFNITDGPGITWRNASGLFGKIWNRVLPSPTPTPSSSSSDSESSTPEAFSTVLNNISLSQEQSSDPTTSGDSTESFSTTTGDSSINSTTEETLASPSPSNASSPINSSALPESSMQISEEPLSTRGSSSEGPNTLPVIEIEVHPLTVSPYIDSWELVDGAIHVTFLETLTLDEGTEIVLFTFDNEELPLWENVVLLNDSECFDDEEVFIEDNGDGTSSYILLFEGTSNNCQIANKSLMLSSRRNTIVTFFFGIFGRVKNWV